MANSVFIGFDSSSPVFNNVTVIGDSSSGRFLAADGSLAVPSISFTNDPDTGFYKAGLGQINLSVDGLTSGSLTNTGWTTPTSIYVGTAQDVRLLRGAADRLDLATGDSFYMVSGGLGVGTINTIAGTIVATGNISTGNANAFVITSNGTLAAGGGSGKINLTDANATTGVGFDVATDSILKVRNRAQNAYATIDALGYSVSGVAGASKAAGPVVSITVVNGIVTAIS